MVNESVGVGGINQLDYHLCSHSGHMTLLAAHLYPRLTRCWTGFRNGRGERGGRERKDLAIELVLPLGGGDGCGVEGGRGETRGMDEEVGRP